jgi:N-acetylneuraminic acid mutarotase
MRHHSKRRAGTYLSLAAALLVAGAGAVQAQDAGSWSARQDGLSFSSGAAATDGSLLYLVGGLQDGSTNRLRSYDPATDSWMDLASLDVGVLENAAACHGGTLYSIGGVETTHWMTVDSIMAYSIAANTWDALPVAHLSAGRVRLAAATLGDSIYVTGGYGNDFSVAHDVFDPATKKVTAGKDMPVSLLLHTMTAVPSLNRIYVATGFDMGGPSAWNFAYDPDSDTWTELAPLADGSGTPLYRYAAASFALQGRVYVVGGYDGAGADVATWEYNPETNTWSQRASMSAGRQFHGAAAINDLGYAYGGFGADFVEEFTPPVFAPPPAGNHAPVADAGGDQTAEATSASGASVTLDGSATDADGDQLTYSWSGSFGTADGAAPTVTLALGTHTLTLTVSDGTDESSDQVVIMVEDSTAPSFSSLTASPDTLWSPKKDMRQVTVSASAADAGDGSPEIEIIGVSCNQAADGDWVITGAMTVNLRAERSNGQARTYTICVRCTDSSGNSSLSTVTVLVPHSQGNEGDAIQGANASKAKK